MFLSSEIIIIFFILFSLAKANNFSCPPKCFSYSAEQIIVSIFNPLKAIPDRFGTSLFTSGLIIDMFLFSKKIT